MLALEFVRIAWYLAGRCHQAVEDQVEAGRGVDGAGRAHVLRTDLRVDAGPGERAYEEFIKAIHSGRLEAREGV